VADSTTSSVLTAVAGAYASASEYEDHGEVLKGSTPCVRFQTRFRRDQLFHFEYEGGHPGQPLQPWARVTREDGRLTFWTVLNVVAPESLSLCIAALTGISSGSAHRVPCLLMPAEVGGWRATDLVGAVLKPDCDIDGTVCFHIRGNHPRGLGSVSLFIEKERHFIRRCLDSLGYVTEYRITHAG
jgi:hypothetical protein